MSAISIDELAARISAMIGGYHEEKVLTSYLENGYFVFRGVLPIDLVDEAINEIDCVLRAQFELYYGAEIYPGRDDAAKRLMTRNLNYRRRLYKWLNSRMLTPQKFASLPVVVDILEVLKIEQPMFQMAANRFHLPEEDHFLTEIHQDIGVMETENSATFWFPLIRIDETNGTIRVYRGSHKDGVIVPSRINYRGHSEIDPDVVGMYEAVEEAYDPGDLLVFHTKTLHTATPNRSDNCRWGAIFRFDDGADNQYFDSEENPLSKGYIMKPSQGTTSGFTEGSANEDLADEKKSEVVKAYRALEEDQAQ